MKKNIFHKMLVSLFMIGSLLTIVSVSAQEDRDWLPQGQIDSAQFIFDRVMTQPWSRAFRVRLNNNWGYLSVNQQAQIVQRMVDQGLISPSQAEESNWIDSETAPEVTIGG
jgi:hypothetical protein